MLRNKLLSLAFVLLLIVVFADVAFSQKSALNGEQIVRKMAEQYANSKSYSDVGVVQTVSGKDERIIETNVSFKTYFVRPKKLRFEWEDSPPFKSWHIVWSDGKDAYTFWESGKLEKEESLSMALAGATGVSGGSAHTISVLLMEDAGGFKLTEMSRISLLREEQFEGEDCFVVRGYHPFGFPIDLWISKNDFLLRKEREQNEDKTFSEEIRRNVKLDGTIPSETFQYTPPAATPKKDSLIGYCSPTIILPLGLFLLTSLKK